MLNENLKFVFQFTLLILTQIILLDNINLFGFLNPIIYILFIITYKFDQNQTLFIFLCFLLGFITDLLTQSSGANTISCLIDEWKPDQLLVGQPFNMDGTPSDMMQKVDPFFKKLKAEIIDSPALVRHTLD